MMGQPLNGNRVRHLLNIFHFKTLSPMGRYAVLAPAVAFLAAIAFAGHLSPLAAIVIALVLAAGGAVFLRERADTPSEPEVREEMPAAVLDAISDAVILLDEDRTVTAANEAARELLDERLEGRDLALSLRHPEALEAANEAISGRVKSSAEIVMHVPVQRVFLVQAVPLPEDPASPPRFLVVLQEVTASRNAEQIRADFVANVSHELRSPLTSLVGFIETLRGVAHDDPAPRDRFLHIMAEESQRMARLIDDLLSLSRVEANEHVRPDGQLDIAELLAGVVDSVSVQAQEKNMPIDVTDPAPSLPVIGDRDELFEVFQNLVVNAVKYGREETPVRIEVSSVERIPEVGGRGLSVAVIDRGDGIAAEDIPRLTERFYRVDKGRSRSMGGTGLGLAIVKHIVNRHRGRLVIRSDVGEGSQFIVYLPVADLEEAQKTS